MNKGKLKYLDMDALKEWEKSTKDNVNIHNYTYALCVQLDEEDTSTRLRISNSFFLSDITSSAQFESLYFRMLKGKAHIDVYCPDNDYVVIRVSHLPTHRTAFLAPAQFCKVELDSGNITFLQGIVSRGVSNSIKGTIIPATVQGVSILEIASQAIDNKEKLAQQQQLIEKSQREMKEKEAILRAELDKKIRDLRDDAAKQLSILEEKKEEFEKEFFKIEMSIDTLRSLLGDNYSLAQLRNGARAGLETPLVIFQKLHFLDEDFAKLMVLYNDGKGMFNFNYFDEAISKQDTLFEYFCPSEKCVSVARISADGVYYSTSIGGGNILDSYAIEHGSNICILVRDGEQLFALWCEDKITLSGDDLIASSQEVIEVEEGKNYKVKEVRHLCKRIISRKTIFNILSGLSLYRTPPILQVEGGFVLGNNKIIYSTADNWLSDARPELSEIIKQVNLDTKVGDYILPIHSISGYHDYGGVWREIEDRGRGNSLSKDASIPNEVVKVNLIEAEEDCCWIDKKAHFPTLVNYPQEHPELLLQLKDKMLSSYNKAEGRYPSTVSIEVPCPPYLLTEEDKVSNSQGAESRLKATYVARFTVSAISAGAGYVWKEAAFSNYTTLGINKQWRMSSEPKLHIFRKLPVQDQRIFVSCEKQWSSKNAKANIQIMLDEFLNLTYIGSELLLYYISSKKTGSINSNFTSAVETLKKALDFVRARENNTLILLNRTASKPLDEKVIFLQLYKWQEENKIHTMTSFQAKRFLKAIKII